MKMRFFFDLISKAIEVITIVLLILMLTIISTQVFLRFVLNSPTSWSEELSIVLLIWFGFLGIALGVREDKHIAIGYFYDKFRKKYRTALDIFYQVLLVIFSLMMIVQGMAIIKVAKFQTLPATGLNRSIFYLALIVSGALIALYCTEYFLNLFRRKIEEIKRKP